MKFKTWLAGLVRVIQKAVEIRFRREPYQQQTILAHQQRHAGRSCAAPVLLPAFDNKDAYILSLKAILLPRQADGIHRRRSDDPPLFRLATGGLL